MPRPVEQVPNSWLPYMDGQIWEFTEDEVRGMPGWNPMHNACGEVTGMMQMRWFVRGKVYVRFYSEATPGRQDPDVLAGWKAPLRDSGDLPLDGSAAEVGGQPESGVDAGGAQG